MILGLRIDVDTLRGTREGVPNLCRLLDAHDIRGTFFFSVGPDNMGRHLLRILRPAFFSKMMRTGASRLYGWDILLRGTLWPGPIVGERMSAVIRATAEAGHEIGLHAWDHHAWQARIDRMDGRAVHSALDRGHKLLTAVLGHAPACSAAPAWKCNDRVLLEKSKFPFLFNSDCRGREIFLPLVQGRPVPQPQIPTTLPTYDEVIGLRGITQRSYNDYLLGLLDPAGLNVLTIHAEVEGMACLEMFRGFLEGARSRGTKVVPLGTLLGGRTPYDPCRVVRRELTGRQGWLAFQGECHAP